ncbi:hypothetical protein [Flavobacterium hercynium]|nr:hypothetical protein [Flavobacterium hercynium]
MSFKILSFFAIFFSCQKTVPKQFKESDNTAVFTTKYVVYENKEITTVYHFKEDGTWQFSSNDKVENFEDVVMIVAIKQIVKRDKTILEIADLPLGFVAHRNSKKEKWTIQKIKN